MTTIKRRFAALNLISLAALVGLTLSACSSGASHQRDSQGNILPSARELDPASTLYSDTMDAANSGNCSQQVVSVLVCYSYRGHGYEGAQTALGECQLKNKNTEEGLSWLERAANAGWPDAQKALADAYLTGEGVAKDPVKAGKWVLLYRKNPSLLSLGVQPDMDLVKKVSTELDEGEKTEARAAATAWRASFWQPDRKLDLMTKAACYAAPSQAIKKPTMDDVHIGTDGNRSGGY